MNHERLEALLWERIDGTISDEDLAWLEAAIAEHPEPRHLEREIARIAKRLEELPTMEPPSQLKARINAGLERTRPLAHPATAPFAIRSRRWTDRPERWLPLAACVLIGVGVGYLLPTIGGDGIDESRVVGAIGASVAPHGPPLMIGLDGELGSVIVSRGATSTNVDLDLTTEAEVTLTLEQTGQVLEISALDDTGGAPTTVSTAGGSVVLRTRGPGGLRIEVTTGEGPTPLRIEVTAEGAVVAERWLDLPPSGDGS